MDATAFIQAKLTLAPVPSCPSLRLYRAHAGSGIERLVGEGGPAPYWAYPWGGGLALARYLLGRPESIRGRRVVDLGAGGGLVAIAAARAGAAAVTAVDVDPHAMAAVALNAAANGVEVSPLRADLLDGPAPPDTDLVLAGDLFYDRRLARRTLAFLDRCQAAGVAVLIGDPWRAPLPRARLRVLADDAVPDVGGVGTTPAAVFALSPAAPRSPGRRGSRRSP